MEKLIIIIVLMLISLSTATSISGSVEEARRHDDESELRNLCFGKEKITKLHFYVQDLIGGEKPTVWKVAQSNLTYALPSLFGLVAVLDNLVTSGPEIGSKEVGRLQGVIGLSDLDEKALVMLVNIVFTEGEFKGSTLSILGRNPLEDQVREVSIVGGTGAFRMARGYVITRTHSIDLAQTHGVYEYNVVLSHFDHKTTC